MRLGCVAAGLRGVQYRGQVFGIAVVSSYSEHCVVANIGWAADAEMNGVLVGLDLVAGWLIHGGSSGYLLVVKELPAP